MNRVCIVPTQFHNLTDPDNQFSLGFRAYDDNGQCYDNTMGRNGEDNGEFLAAVHEPIKFLELVLNHSTGNEELDDMLMDAYNDEKSIEVCGDEIRFNDYAPILEKHEVV